MSQSPFHIETEEAADGRLTVDIEGLGSVAINVTDEGVALDVFPLHVVDEPLHSAYLLNDDFFNHDREEE